MGGKVFLFHVKGAQEIMNIYTQDCLMGSMQKEIDFLSLVIIVMVASLELE